MDPTPEEQQELTCNPIGSNRASEWNLPLRWSIAKKISQLIIDDGGDEYGPLYEKYPAYGFYTDVEGKMIWRLYGVGIADDKQEFAHTCCALTGMNNLAERPLKDLIRVEQWSESQLAFLTSGLVMRPEIFLDPLGFCLLAK